MVNGGLRAGRFQGTHMMAAETQACKTTNAQLSETKQQADIHYICVYIYEE